MGAGPCEVLAAGCSEVNTQAFQKALEWGVSPFRQEQKWSPGGWFCRHWGSFHIFLPQLCHQEAACRRLVALVSPLSSQPAPGPSHTTPLPSPSSPTCHQDVGGKMSTRPFWTFNFVLSCELESVQRCPSPWNLPDPSPGPSSSQPLKCLLQEDHLILPPPSFGLLPLCHPSARLWVGAPRIPVLSESSLAWRDMAGKVQCTRRLCSLW